MWAVGGHRGAPGLSGGTGRSYNYPVRSAASALRSIMASSSLDHTPPPPPSKRLLFSLSGQQRIGRTCPGRPRQGPGVVPRPGPGRSGPDLGLIGWRGPRTASKAPVLQPQLAHFTLVLLQGLGLRWSFGFCEGHLGRVAALRACTPLAVLAAASGLSRVVCGLNGPSVYPTRHP